MVILDTNIIIDHLRLQRTHRQSRLMKIVRSYPKEELALSVVSIQELYEGKSTQDPYKEQHLLATITPLKILPYTLEIAQTAGEIARDIDRPIELADAAIAATCIINGGKLVTLDKADFRGIKQLVFL